MMYLGRLYVVSMKYYQWYSVWHITGVNTRYDKDFVMSCFRTYMLITWSRFMEKKHIRDMAFFKTYAVKIVWLTGKLRKSQNTPYEGVINRNAQLSCDQLTTQWSSQTDKIRTLSMSANITEVILNIVTIKKASEEKLSYTTKQSSSSLDLPWCVFVFSSQPRPSSWRE